MVVVMRRDSIGLQCGPASPCTRTHRTIARSYGACEMPTSERAPEHGANLLAIRVGDIEPRGNSVQHPSIGTDDLPHRLVRDVEDELVPPNACLPEPRQVFGAFDGS